MKSLILAKKTLKSNLPQRGYRRLFHEIVVWTLESNHGFERYRRIMDLDINVKSFLLRICDYDYDLYDRA